MQLLLKADCNRPHSELLLNARRRDGILCVLCASAVPGVDVRIQHLQPPRRRECREEL